MGAALPLVMWVGWLGGFGVGMVVIAPGRGGAPRDRGRGHRVRMGMWLRAGDLGGGGAGGGLVDHAELGHPAGYTPQAGLTGRARPAQQPRNGFSLAEQPE